MALVDVLGIIKVKCEEAAGLQLAGNDSQGIAVLQQVATVISSEFGATDEVAADTPEDDEKPEEAEPVEWLFNCGKIAERVRGSEAAFVAGNNEEARTFLTFAAELISDLLATESG